MKNVQMKNMIVLLITFICAMASAQGVTAKERKGEVTIQFNLNVPADVFKEQ